MDVTIGGVRYIPARDVDGRRVREAVCRCLARLYWGEIAKENWKEDFERKMGDVNICATDGERGTNAIELVDAIIEEAQLD